MKRRGIELAMLCLQTWGGSRSAACFCFGLRHVWWTGGSAITLKIMLLLWTWWWQVEISVTLKEREDRQERWLSLYTPTSPSMDLRRSSQEAHRYQFLFLMAWLPLPNLFLRVNMDTAFDQGAGSSGWVLYGTVVDCWQPRNSHGVGMFIRTLKYAECLVLSYADEL